jgi:hypothetical protein
VADTSGSVSVLNVPGTQRSFYLTRTLHPAPGAPGACAAGYHFASIWEISDPSALRYNTELGVVSPDSGEGPPTVTKIWLLVVTVHGWVRTDSVDDTSTGIGQANCLGWQSDSDSDSGSVANLPSDWTGGAQDIGVWNTEVRTCDTNMRVWCVQDDGLWRLHLPLVIDG